MKNSLIFIMLVVVFVSTGCMVGSDYHQPEIKLLTAFNETPFVQSEISDTELKEWWKKFDDPELNILIARGIESNHDLRVAIAKVKEVRARYGVSIGDLWPSLNMSSGYARNRISENTPQGQRTLDLESSLYQAGFDASWEIDIFGGIKREIEAATADIATALEGSRAVLVTLIGEIVKNYTELQGNQRQISITVANLRLQKQIIVLVNSKYQAGLNSYLDVARSEAQMATTSAQLPLLEKISKNYRYRLTVLTGMAITDLERELPTAQSVRILPEAITAGIPAELLRRRPDIRKAEMELAAASARVGMAIADFFPRFSLTGSFGLQSEKSADLVGSSSSRYWSIGPTVRWPIFTAGRVKANLEVQDAKYEQALTLYKQTIIKALEEVENALASYSAEKTRIASLTTVLQSHRIAMAIATELYEKGLADFLGVLDAERAVLATEMQLAQSQTQLTISLAALYKVLGGGWSLYHPIA